LVLHTHKFQNAPCHHIQKEIIPRAARHDRSQNIPNPSTHTSASPRSRYVDIDQEAHLMGSSGLALGDILRVTGTTKDLDIA
jgi:hypothetical protein